MKKEGLLVSLFGLKVLFVLYYILETIEAIKKMWIGNDMWINSTYLTSTFTYHLFYTIGIIGVVRYVQNKNIFNPYFKVFAIYNVFSFFVYLPITIYEFNIWSQDVEYLLFQILDFIFVVFAIIVLAREKLNVKELPVQKSSTRFKHFLIDILFLAITYIQFDESFYWIANNDNLFEPSPSTNFLLPYYFYLVYFWVSESIFQQTIGKVFTKKFVRRIDGNRAGSWSILGRSLSRFIPLEPFSYLSSPLNGWHDNLSNTNVFESSEELEDGIIEHLIDDNETWR